MSTRPGADGSTFRRFSPRHVSTFQPVSSRILLCKENIPTIPFFCAKHLNEAHFLCSTTGANSLRCLAWSGAVDDLVTRTKNLHSLICRPLLQGAPRGVSEPSLSIQRAHTLQTPAYVLNVFIQTRSRHEAPTKFWSPTSPLGLDTASKDRILDCL